MDGGKKLMWNKPTDKQLSKIPKLYATQNTRPENKKIYMHFFIGDTDWYIAEYDGEDLFYGFTILNGWVNDAEWGYISYKELQSLRVPPGFEVDRDMYWTVVKAGDIEKIHSCPHAFSKKFKKKVK